MRAGLSRALSTTRRVVTRRPWVSAAVAVVVVGGGIAAYAFTGSDPGPAAAAGATTRLVTVSSGTVRESVSATGTLAPADEEDVSFASAAEITSVRVTQGEKVAKGQTLGTISTVALQATLAQARVTLADAKATLASAEDDSSATSDQLTADRASVTSARSAVTDAKAAVAGATLRSPIAGTVAEVNVATGDRASGSGSSDTGSSTGSSTGSTGSGGSGTGSGGTATGSTGSGGTGSTSSSSSSSSGDFVVVGMRSWTVSASVDDTEVGLISKGDQAQLTTDNVTGTVFGTVSSVSVLSSSSSGSATYPVTIAVTGSPSGLHDGASATVAIVYRQVSNVLTVPTLAVHRSGTTSYVYVSKNGAKAKQTVTTGIASGGTTQVKSGLTSGQQVYVQTVTRTGTGTSGTNRRSGSGGYGTFPGGGSGNFPGGGSGNFPGGGGGFPGGTR